MPDKRRRTRIDLRLEAKVYNGEDVIGSWTKNLSLKGVLLEYRDELASLELGKVYKLNLLHAGCLEMNVLARLVDRQEQRGVAFDFVRLDELSFRHLFNLIRMNSDDPDLIEEELLNPAFDVRDLDD